MNPIPLQLRKQSAPVREARAALLPPSSASSVLETLVAMDVPASDWRLLALPNPADDSAPGPLLALLPPGARSVVATQSSRYGCIREKLWLPVDAVVWPPVTDEELVGMVTGVVAVWHPGIGLVQFGEHEIGSVAELLAPPVWSGISWNHACAGETLSHQLRKVKLVSVPDFGSMFARESGNIGSEPPVGLPPREGEPDPGKLSQLARKTGAGLMGGLGAMIGGLADLFKTDPKPPASASGKPEAQPPASGSGSGSAGGSGSGGLLGGLAAWASGLSKGLVRQIEDARNRELHRLMDMLERDPENGLRHAIPFGGGGAGRGITAPGTRLGLNDLDFHAQNFAGGAPVDYWSIPPEFQRQLAQRYRDLAMQEATHGRHLRAAYIYAHLLGDLESAAAVLHRGRHYAEAAVLYRDKLKNPRAAAENFALAGMVDQAAELYRKLGLFYELGELYLKFGMEREGMAAFRLAVEEKLAQGNFCTAAQILENRMNAPDEALAALRRPWPDGAHSMSCLEAEFSLLTRLERHEEAGKRLGELSAFSARGRELPLLQLVSGLARNHPSPNIQTLAREHIQTRISLILDYAGANLCERILPTLREVAPDDALLMRDIVRYVADLRERERVSAFRAAPAGLRRIPSLPLAMPEPVLVREFDILRGAIFLAARRCGPNYIAAIQKDNQLSAVLGDWWGESGTLEYPLCRMPEERTALTAPRLIVDEHDPAPVSCFLGSLRDPTRIFNRFIWNDAGRASVTAGVPSWFPNDVIAVAVARNNWWLLRLGSTGAVIELWRSDGEILQSFGLPELMFYLEVGAPILLAMGSQLWLGIGPELFLIEGRAIKRQWTLPAPCLHLTPTGRWVAPGVLITCQGGCALIRQAELPDVIDLAFDFMERPIAGFAAMGFIVATDAGNSAPVNPRKAYVYDIVGSSVQRSAEFQWQGAPPVAILRGEAANEFAIVTALGQLRIFRIPAARR